MSWDKHDTCNAISRRVYKRAFQDHSVETEIIAWDTSNALHAVD